MCAELRMEKRKMKVASLGKASSVPDLSGEVILQNQLEFCLGEEEEIYEGYGKVKSAYPYRQRNGYTRKLQEKEIQTVILENSYLKAVFLPEYGGRLWELWDKEQEKNLLYTNDVLRFSNLAVRNAWFSGGVEWNVGIIGHNPFTAEQMYVARTEDEKGNPVLRMYEYERVRDITYQMDFWLEEDSHFLNCRMRIVNENTEVVPMYWWSNIAVPEYEGGRIIVPSKSAYTFVHGSVHKVNIPRVRGIDITEYKKIPKSIDYFFELEEHAPRYIASVDGEGYGLLQISTSRLKSRKLFSWGKQKASNHWQEFLTEKAGRYLEIQAGITKTQYGCLPMAPNTAWEWLEQYGAVRVGKRELELSHEERYKNLSDRLLKEKVPEQLEEKLKSSKKTALGKAKLLMPGSGYGILGVHKGLTAHLQFSDKEGEYSRWQTFIDGGRLHCPDPKKRPDVYLDDAASMARLKEAVKTEEKENWYAHYHLGVRYYISERYKRAKKEFQASLELQENAWAYHGLACLSLLKEKRKKAVQYILKGMELQREELSYIKEGFKLLLAGEGYEELCAFYEKMTEEFQDNSRLKFCYIKALKETGKEQKAYEWMEKNGGLVLDDVREGEDSLAELWISLHGKLYGGEKEVPYRYQFKTYE